MTEPPHTPATPASPASDDVKAGPIIGLLVVSAFVMILNETILSVALPTLMADLQITATTAQWLSTGFLLTMGVVIPTTGFVLNRFRTRVVFAAALSLFCLGTLVCALAPGSAVLLTGRVLQAGGTALVLPLLMTSVMTLIPPHRRGAVMGLTSVVITAAPAVGPTVSGFVLQAFDWHALFWLVLPIGLAGLTAGLVLLKDFGTPRPLRLDAVSVLLSVFAFGGLMLALTGLEALAHGGAPVTAIVAGAVGAVGLVLFVRRQNARAAHPEQTPLLALSPLRVLPFRLSLLAVGSAMATMLGAAMLLPLYLENGLGLAPALVGLCLLPGGAIQAVLGPVIGRLYDLHGPRPLVLPGLALMSGTQLVQAAVLGPDTPVAAVVGLNLFFGLGMALVMTPLMTLSLSSLPARDTADGSAILNTVQQLAGAFGITVFITLFSLGAGSDSQSAASAVWLPFLVGGLLSAAAGVGALRIRRLQSANSQVR